jgi:uncharacterized repeat protein (TIGR01451 family)
VPGGPPGLFPAPGEDGDDIDPPAPQVRIRVRVPSVATAGKELEYRLIVENMGRGAAHHTVVRATLPASVRFVRAIPEPSTTDPEPRWQLGTLPGCGTKEITLIVVPTGEADVRVCARVMSEYGQCVQTRIAGKAPRTDDRIRIPVPMPGPEPGPRPFPQPPMGNPNLTINVTTPPRPVSLFDMVPVTIEVTNTGTGPARDVNVRATLAPGLKVSKVTPMETAEGTLEWALGTIGAGQRKRIELQLVAEKAGTLAIDAELTDAGGTKKAGHGQVQVSEVKLDIIKKGPASRLVGGTAIYTIQVTNSGDVPASNVVVTDEIPELIEFIRATAGGKMVGTTVRWELGTLPPGERREVRLEIRCKVAGTLKNRATAKSDRMEKGVTAEAETAFENVTGLTAEIDSDTPVMEVGKTVLYTIRVINQGDGEAENVGLTVTLPPELTLVGDPVGPIMAVMGPGPIVFPPQVKIPGKEKREYKIRAQATMPGEVKVHVEVTAKTLERGPLVREEATTIYGKKP